MTSPVLITGPTASGKSDLAVRLARRDGGVILNADASQVYSCWRVLTARPRDADLALAPHRLYGHVAPHVRYSVGDWLSEAAEEIAAARSDGLRPIFVGGTGLYLHALTHGLATIPPIPPELRQRSQAQIDAGGLADLVAALDPETRARVDTRNPRRVQRAWEVLTATGRGLARWHTEPQPPLVSPDTAERYLLEPDTETLDRRIADRFASMVATGALDEVAAFASGSPDWSLPSAQALGVRDILRHLDGEATLDETINAGALATRQFAKRQRTWFRNRMADWPRVKIDYLQTHVAHD